MSTSAMVTLHNETKYTIGSFFQNLQQIPFSFDHFENPYIALAKLHAVTTRPSEHLVMIGISSPGIITRQNNMGT